MTLGVESIGIYICQHLTNLVSFESRRVNTLVVIVLVILVLSLSGVAFFILNQNDYQVHPEDVKVGIVDSGCYESQLHLVRAESFANFTYGYSTNVNDPYDYLSHGGRVCKKISRIAPNAAIYSAKIATNKGEITYDGLIGAISWLVEDIGVDVINLSLGAFFYLSDEFHEVLKAYSDLGVIFVAASGNDGGRDNLGYVGLLQWPGVVPWTIAVGAIDYNGDVTAYSSFGSSIYQRDVVEFAADGQAGNVYGTSFSAPEITGMIARVMRLLTDNGYSSTPQLIQTILALSGNQEYSNTTGWGLPDLELITSQFDSLVETANSTLLIEAANITDSVVRFTGEYVRMNFKVIGSLPLDIQISGVDDPEWREVTSGSWGSLVEVGFRIPDQNETTLEIRANNTVQIHIIAEERNFTQVLMDNSLSASGYNFQGASLRYLDEKLRAEGYLPEYENNAHNLSNYDLVILLDAGEHFYSDSGRAFSQTDNTSIYDPYLEYINSGGKVFIFGNSTEDDKNTLPYLLNPLGIDVTSTVGSKNEFVTSDNFTQNPDYTSFFTGISRIAYKGMGMNSHSSNAEEIVWYTEIINNGVTSKKVNHALAIAGSYGSGYFVVSNSLDALRNFQISSKDANVLFLMNSLQWLFDQTSQANV